MTDQLTAQSVATPTEVVERFLSAMQEQDLDTLSDLVADDILYENVGFSRVRGRRGVLRILGGLRRPGVGFEVQNHRIAADGGTVLTERSDALTFGRRFRTQFWVCGTFEVRDGKVAVWRDYFDTVDVLKGTVRGLLGIVVPSLRRSF